MIDSDEPPTQSEQMSSPTPTRRAQEISDLLTSQGIPSRRQRSFLSMVLGCSYANTRRRLLGEIPFSTLELDLIAKHLGLCLTFQFTPATAEAQAGTPHAASANQSRSLAAKIEIQGLDLDCIVEESPKPNLPLAADGLGLLKQTDPSDSVYRVVRSSTVLSHRPISALASIKIVPVYARSGPSLAIVESIASEGEDLMRSLSTAGFRTELFGSPTAVLPEGTTPSQLQQPPRFFDAYLIDFVVDHEQDIEHMISSVRRVQPQAAVVLMSDKLGDDLVTEAAGRLIQAHGVSLIPKPSPTFAIVAQLRHEIERLRMKDSTPSDLARTPA